jgi:hypothetical protein
MEGEICRVLIEKQCITHQFDTGLRRQKLRSSGLPQAV